MKCPYQDCQKDYNDQEWRPAIKSFIREHDSDGEVRVYNRFERTTMNRLYVVTRDCRFCKRYFHELSIGNEIFDKYGTLQDTIFESLVSYPSSKTSFVSKRIPKDVLSAFNEAEKCRSVGSITGTGACLRKAVYALCDQQKVIGTDYREKIAKLAVKDNYKELLKQFKWLGDNVTKPGEEKYTTSMIDVALEILPIIIDSIYTEAEKEEDAIKLLAKARSANPDKPKV